MTGCLLLFLHLLIVNFVYSDSCLMRVKLFEYAPSDWMIINLSIVFPQFDYSSKCRSSSHLVGRDTKTWIPNIINYCSITAHDRNLARSSKRMNSKTSSLRGNSKDRFVIEYYVFDTFFLSNPSPYCLASSTVS